MPVVAHVFVHPESGRCSFSTKTTLSGEFAIDCTAVEVGSRIEAHSLLASGYESGKADLVVPPAGTPAPTLLIALPSPQTPAATATLVDYYGWSMVEGRVSNAEAPLPDALIVVNSWFGNADWGGTDASMKCWSPVLADEAGRFEVFCKGGRTPDWTKYRIRISMDRYDPFETIVPIENPGGPFEVILKLSTPSATPSVTSTPASSPDRRRFVPFLGYVNED
jgi:hypothetical protein